MAAGLPLFDALDQLLRAIPVERANLARVARREGLGPEDALDCVHDALCTFLKLAQRGEAAPPSGGGGDGHLGATLATMVRNAARNKRRAHHFAKPHHDIDSLEVGDEVVPTETLLAHAEDHLRLRACVARLCDSQRAVVTLRMLEERQGEDVAALLGISRGHVDVLLHRAKSRLRSCMLEGARPSDSAP
jgi:RNA polymerase sigma-70 factor (ECF subfamily)